MLYDVTQQHVDRGHFVTTFMRAGHVEIAFNSLCHGSKENLILILLCAAPRDFPYTHKRLTKVRG